MRTDQTYHQDTLKNPYLKNTDTASNERNPNALSMFTACGVKGKVWGSDLAVTRLAMVWVQPSGVTHGAAGSDTGRAGSDAPRKPDTSVFHKYCNFTVSL
jgi:hypothetical protein